MMATKKSTRRAVQRRAHASQAGKGKIVAAPNKAVVINMISNSLSGETNQDSEPHLTVNPANPAQIVATAFGPNPHGLSFGGVYVSDDGGNTWNVNPIVPSDVGSATGTLDITTCFGGDGKALYAGILRDPTFNLEFLRTNSPTVPMTVLASRPNADQPFTHATTVTSGPDSGKDRVYIGENDFNAQPMSATLDETMDGNVAAPAFTSVRVEKRATSGQNGPQIRPASHPDGTVYAAYYGWRSVMGDFKLNTLVITSADLVVVRDDNWGTGPNPFTALVDTGDGKAGLRLAQNISFPFMRFGTPATGQQRIGGSISIAVDPGNSSVVWLAWGDQQSGTFLTLHVRRSTDRGKTWSKDLLVVSNACNAALAITKNGVVGLLCQELLAASQWVTSLRFTSDGTHWSTLVLSQAPAGTPTKTFDPYLGDYDHMVATGNDFYGIFSANNAPDLSQFPLGVKYQRNADFTTKTLLDVDNKTPVPVSIDPFFFQVTPDPCQPLSDAADYLRTEKMNLTPLLSDPGVPPQWKAAIRAQIAKLKAQITALQKQLVTCRKQNP
jgi:hypothetical protein